MIQIIKSGVLVNLMRWRYYCFALSALLLIAGTTAAITQGGLNYGIDFKGGSLLQVKLPAANIADVRKALENSSIGSFSLQSLGSNQSEYLILLAKSEQSSLNLQTSATKDAQQILLTAFPKMEVRRIESVGPKVGNELRLAATRAVLFSLVAILLYIWLRFQWRFSIAAVLALFHDVFIVLTFFAITQREINLAVVAAILTIAGYSINDTIVIFDRIREKFRVQSKSNSITLFNQALSETLNRTILTSVTTTLVVLTLLIAGGNIVRNFAIALLLGIISGTYSSIFIASPIVLILSKSKKNQASKNQASGNQLPSTNKKNKAQQPKSKK